MSRNKHNLRGVVIGLWLSVLVVALINSSQLSQAAVKNVSSLEISFPGSDPLFSENNIAPGFSQSKVLTVKNQGSKSRSFSIAIKDGLGVLADELRIEAKDLGSSTIIWDYKLAAIAKYPNSTNIYPSILPGEMKELALRAYLPTSVRNQYQAKSTLLFDLIVGNESTDEDREDENGQEGTLQIESRSEESSEEEQELVVNNTSSQGSRLALSPTTGETQEPKTESLTVTEKPENQLPKITKESPAVGEVKGVAACIDNFWWWLLLLILAVILTAYGLIVRLKPAVIRYIPPTITCLIFLAIYYLLNRSCCSNSFFCKYFVLIELAELLVYLVISTILNKESKEDKEQKSKQQQKQQG